MGDQHELSPAGNAYRFEAPNLLSCISDKRIGWWNLKLPPLPRPREAHNISVV